MADGKDNIMNLFFQHVETQKTATKKPASSEVAKEQTTEKKTDTKAPQKTATKSATKTVTMAGASKAGTSKEVYSTPITVRTGYCKDMTLSADAFSGKESGITEDQIKEAVLRACPWMGTVKLIKLYKYANNCVCAGIDAAGEKAVKSIKVNAETNFFCGPHRLDTYSKLGLTDGEIATKDIESKLFDNGLLGEIIWVEEKNMVIVLPGKQKSFGTVKVPVKLLLFKDSDKEITSDDILKYRESTGDAKKAAPVKPEKEEDEDDGFGPVDETDEESDDEVESISAEELTKVLQKMYPTLENCGEVYSCGKDLYTFRVVIKSSEKKAFAPKKRTFNISNGAVLRYLPYGQAADTAITEEDFEGKTEISEEELWAFSKDKFEEFDEKNSYFDEIVSKNFGLLITVSRKSGSAKGSDPLWRRETLVGESGEKVSREETPLYTACASEITSSHENRLRYKNGFSLKNGKIPGEIFWDILAFFKKVAEHHDAEALCRVYKNGEKYEIVVPEQCCSKTRVETLRPFEQEEVAGEKVFEIHSHGNIRGFFSSVDDNDEIFSGIYGVIGNLADPLGPDVFFRVCVGRQFAYVTLADLFDEGIDRNLSVALPEAMQEGGDKLYHEWLNVASTSNDLQEGGYEE
jgi:hypothetical protein